MPWWRRVRRPVREAFQYAKHILFVIRNGASLDRIRDVVDIFKSDERIKLSYVIHEGSEFEQGLREVLHELKITLIEWKEALRLTFDLIIAAHSHRDLGRLKGKKIVLPHGAGRGKIVPHVTHSRTCAYGVARRQHIRWWRVIASLICASHPEQIERLRRSCARAAKRAEVFGDLTFDQLCFNRPRRNYLRRAFGLNGNQKLIVVSSTWGPNGLIFKHCDLVRQLLAELPVDRFRIALILHPNTWSVLGEAEVRRIFGHELKSGLLILPWRDGWKAAILAADIVFGDHGSVSIYGAALGVPFLQVCTGKEELDQSGPNAAFSEVVRPFIPDQDLRTQIEVHMATHSPSIVTTVTNQILGKRGQSWDLLRNRAYSMMNLLPNVPLAVPQVPDPVPLRGEITSSYHVMTRFHRRSGVFGWTQIERYPAIMCDYNRAQEETEPILVRTEHETCPATDESAEILVYTTPERRVDALTQISKRTTGAGLVAAVISDSNMLIRWHNQAFDATTVQSSTKVSPDLVAAAIYSWLNDPKTTTTTATRAIIALDYGLAPYPITIVFPIPEVTAVWRIANRLYS